MRFLTFLFFVVALTLSSCDSNRIYEKNADLSEGEWLADSALTFRFEINDAEKAYTLQLNVRNTISYPYHNLYVKYYIEDTLGNEIKSELLNYELFEPKTGKPYGDGLGDIFSHQLDILPSYQFTKPGFYQVRLQQFMRQDSLRGILSAGIRLEELKQGK